MAYGIQNEEVETLFYFQAVLIGSQLALKDTIFMKHGPCSNYTGVTHQYALGWDVATTTLAWPFRGARGATVALGNTAAGGTPALAPARTDAGTCTPSTWHANKLARGVELPIQSHTQTAAECCAFANQPPLTFFTEAWTFVNSTGACKLLYSVSGKQADTPGAVTGTHGVEWGCSGQVDYQGVHVCPGVPVSVYLCMHVRACVGVYASVSLCVCACARTHVWFG